MYLQALIWLLVLSNPANAGFVIGIVSAIASTAVGSILVNAVIGIALSVGASLLSNLFAKKSESRDPGTTVSLRVGGANPLMFPLGRTATAGVRVYYGVYSTGGTPNEYMVDVIALSSLPVPGGFINVWMNDVKVTVDTSAPKTQQGWPIVEYRKNGRDYAWFDFHDGTQTNANTFLLNRFGTRSNYPWKNDMIGRGVAYATLTCRYDKDGLWSSGYPSMLVELESVPLYDIRKDDTAGGVGNHRWNDPNTWEPSNNSMVRAYNVARGAFYFNNEWVYGGQDWPAYRLPASSWMAGMNACDKLVDGSPQFHGGGMVECDMEVATVIEELLRSSSALIAEIGGVYKIRVGAPGAPVMSFTDRDIVITREQGFDPFPGLESTYNIARITYTEPDERWSTKESPERRDAAMILSDDGRDLPFSVDLPWVLDNVTAQRIGKTALENGRRFRRHSMYHAPLFWIIEPLDVVAWTSEQFGYSEKNFDIEQISGSSALTQSVIIRENDPSDHVWNPSTDLLPFEVIPMQPDIVPPQIVTGWQVFPASIKDDQSRDRRPSIEVHFDGLLTDIDRLRVQVRINGDIEPFYDIDLPYPSEPTTVSRIILNGDFPPNVACEVRGRFIPYTDRDTEWTAWLHVTTPDIKLGSDDVDLAGIAEEISQEVAEVVEWFNFNTREEIENLWRNVLEDIDQDAANFNDKQTIRKEMSSTYDNAVATAYDFTQTFAGPNSALALRIEQLTAAVDNVESSLTIRAEVLASPGGGWARYGIDLKASNDDEWSEAIFYMDVHPSNGSRVIFQADRFIISDGSDEAHPFLFQDGTAFVQNVVLGTLKFDQLESNNGKLIIKGFDDNASIEIFN